MIPKTKFFTSSVVKLRSSFTTEDEISTSIGNISQISTDLGPNYKIIDVPGKANVTSMSVNKNPDLWAILDNKTPETIDGYIEFKRLPYRKLLTLKNGSNECEEFIINENVKSFLQIEFISNSNEGYLVAEKDKMLFKTIDGGLTWSSTNLNQIRQIRSFNRIMWALSKNNQLFELNFNDL